MSDVEHARFADWDGAYVLGALTPADRHAYEEHLEHCPRCREAIAELTPMPGLLAQIRAEPPEDTADDAADRDPGTSPDAVEGPQPQSVAPAAPDGREHAGHHRPRNHQAGGPRTRPHRRRRILAGALAVAAVLVLALALPLTRTDRAEDEVMTVSVVAPGDDPAAMRVDVELAPQDWGTSLRVTCDYPPAAPAGPAGPGRYGGADAPPSYALVVTAEDGTRSEVSSWQGMPGEVVTLEAGTAIDLADIAAVSVIDPAGATVLTAEVDAS